MNYGIQYVCYLVHKKNELNRKRRRFYSIINPRKRYVREPPSIHFAYGVCVEVKTKRKRRVPITKAYAKKMYRATQREMKAMTAEMRRARKEINARYVWSDHGAIKWIETDEQNYMPDLIARLSDMWEADAILLGE